MAEEEAEQVEELIVWQDVLDEIFAGRTNNLSCPYCGHTPLNVESEGGLTRISCDSCRKFLEGRFGGY